MANWLMFTIWLQILISQFLCTFVLLVFTKVAENIALPTCDVDILKQLSMVYPHKLAKLRSVKKWQNGIGSSLASNIDFTIYCSQCTTLNLKQFTIS